MLLRRYLPLLALFACGEKSASDSSAPAGDATCDVLIDGTWPQDGASDAYYRDPVEFYLSAADPTAAILADFPGLAATRDDGLTLSLTPDPPLDPDTDYSVTLDYCRGAPSIHFHTSAVGQPVADPAALIGQTFAIDPAGGRYLDGAGMADFIFGVFGRSLLLQVLDVRGDALDFRVGISSPNDEPAAHDPCFRTAEFLDHDFTTAPFLRFTEERFQFGAYGVEVNLYGLEITGTFSPDAAEMVGVSYRLAVSATEIAAIIEADGADGVCDIAESVGEPCEPCPDGADDAGDRCLYVSVDRMSGPAVAVDVEEVLLADALPECIEE